MAEIPPNDIVDSPIIGSGELPKTPEISNPAIVMPVTPELEQIRAEAKELINTIDTQGEQKYPDPFEETAKALDEMEQQKEEKRAEMAKDENSNPIDLGTSEDELEQQKEAKRAEMAKVEEPKPVEKMDIKETLDEVREIRDKLAKHANDVLPPLNISDALPPSVQETIRQEYLKRADNLPAEQRKNVDQTNAAHDETEKWDRYLTNQEDLDDQFQQLQDKLDMSRKTRAGYSASEASSTGKRQMTMETKKYQKELDDFVMSNIPEVMWGDYKLPSEKIVEKKHLIIETQQETPVNDFLKKQEDWREIALSRQKSEENDLKRQRDAAVEDARRLREEAVAPTPYASGSELAELVKKDIKRPGTMTESERKIYEEYMKDQEEIAKLKLELETERAANSKEELVTPPPPTENPPEPEAQPEPEAEAPQNDLRTRLRSVSDYLLGGGLGAVAALSGGAITAEVLAQIDPIVAFHLGEYLTTSLVLAANAVAEGVREFGNNHPHLLRIVRGASGGALAASLATTAAATLEMTGVTNILPGWPHGAETTVAQTAEKITTSVPQKVATATNIPQSSEYIVKEGQNLSTIIKDFLHLNNPPEIYRHTVETILGNLDKLPPDKANAISGLDVDKVMHSPKLFRMVMDAGRIIQPGQSFTLK